MDQRLAYALPESHAECATARVIGEVFGIAAEAMPPPFQILAQVTEQKPDR
ncbi:MAG: hypothetical protein ABL904_17525 [Hyphomicrobiaceae bacterium]